MKTRSTEKASEDLEKSKCVLNVSKTASCGWTFNASGNTKQENRSRGTKENFF